ncbi:MAG: hydantoinase B/oxoprolinase family protein [Planctomycetaceae bacterium]
MGRAASASSTQQSAVPDPQFPHPVFFTASRAHHAEIGGIVPGSMPPFSKSLAEEGVLIRNFKLVDAGRSREDELRKLLLSGPNPTRAVRDNLADVAAQIAANQTGSARLRELAERYGLSVVQAYMGHIQQAAARQMRLALAAIPDGAYQFTDHLDDGSPIAVQITVAGDGATVDFTGTGPVLGSNLNANRAIVTAAVLYVFRCLIEQEIPLNGGVLAPIQVVLPECLLNPPEHDDPALCPAIVGGNVETSQRVVDVLLGALSVAAASQGTMNNLSFGDDTFGYYETICGGAGATPAADGADAVHTHMTNTRLTDPEVIERRYPVRLLEFSIRRGSGGRIQCAGERGGVSRPVATNESGGVSRAVKNSPLPPGEGQGEGRPPRSSANCPHPSPPPMGDGAARTVSHQAVNPPVAGTMIHRGGDGVVRKFEFLKALRVSLLSERRGPYAPFGLNGGPPGMLGKNTLQRAGRDEIVDLGGKAQLDVQPGDVLTIATPGGGAFGRER